MRHLLDTHSQKVHHPTILGLRLGLALGQG